MKRTGYERMVGAVAAVVLEVAATGRLRPGARVAVEDELFVPPDHVPGLEHLLGRPAYHFTEEGGASALWRRVPMPRC